MNASPPKSGLNWEIFAKTYCHMGVSVVAQLVNNPPAMQKTLVRSLGWENPLIPWRRAWQPTPVFLSGESYGHRSLVGYSPWGSQRVRQNWVTKYSTALPFWASQVAQWFRKKIPPVKAGDPLEKEMATHSSTPVWEIPLTEEPGGL